MLDRVSWCQKVGRDPDGIMSSLRYHNNKKRFVALIHYPKNQQLNLGSTDMKGVAFLIFVLLAYNANGASIAETFLEKSVVDMKDIARNKVEELRAEVGKAAEELEGELRKAIASGEQALDQMVTSALSAALSAPKECVKQVHFEVLGNARGSLLKCPQLVRVISDGTDIGRQGVELAAEILSTLDNFLEAVTGCVVAPGQSTSNKVACYIGTVGTLASGIASNYNDVDFYISVVKRDIADIHAAVKLCTSNSSPIAADIRNAVLDINNCKQKQK